MHVSQTSSQWIGPGQADPTGAPVPESAFEVLHKGGGAYDGGASSRSDSGGSSGKFSLSQASTGGEPLSQDISLSQVSEGGRARRASAGAKIKYTDDGSECVPHPGHSSFLY